MKKFFKAFFSFLFISSTVGLNAEVKFISPIKGTWANKQMLVIEQEPDSEYFYSLDGSDPETFGFAYDGPVLLDVTGKINLKVSHNYYDGRKETAAVDFTVNPDPALEKPYGDFIQSFYDIGIINYSSGAALDIPSNLMYSLGLPPDSYNRGTKISISEKNVLTRNIPCTILDTVLNKTWRFIIKTFPQNAGTYSRNDLPFSISDWETITFTNKNLLFKIDNEYWELPKSSRKLDRTKSHMILWQDLNYDKDNPIEFFVLPPRPVINLEKNEDGSFVYSILDDSSYKLGILSAKENEYQEIFSEIGADVFAGDRISGTFNVGVYANSLYQGEFPVEYNINKRAISAPIIMSDAKSFYSRDKVHVVIDSENSLDLFVAVSSPYIIPNTEKIPSQNSDILRNIEVNEYVYNKNHFEIDFLPKEGSPVYYKIKAYNKKNRLKSFVSEYSVIIDQYNYYFVEDCESDFADGSFENPYNSFEVCLNEIKKSDSVCLRIKGNAVIPPGEHILKNKLEISNYEDGLLTFSKDASFVLENADLSIRDCRIENVTGTSREIKPLFLLKNSKLDVKDCQLATNFQNNAVVFDVSDSELSLKNCMVSVTASSYTSFISSDNSQIKVASSNINTVGETSVILSATKGTVLVKNTLLKVSGTSGRIAELYDVKGNFSDNLFSASLTKTEKKFTPIFKNKNTEVNDFNNEYIGF